MASLVFGWNILTDNSIFAQRYLSVRFARVPAVGEERNAKFAHFDLENVIYGL